MMSAVVFLIMTSLRYHVGLEDREHKENRYKKDAMEFYNDDINFFSFSFVLFSLNVIEMIFISNKLDQSEEQDDKEILQKDYKIYGCMVAITGIQLIFNPTVHDSQRKYIIRNSFFYVFISCSYIILFFFHWYISAGHIVRAQLILDLTVFI